MSQEITLKSGSQAIISLNSDFIILTYNEKAKDLFQTIFAQQLQSQKEFPIFFNNSVQSKLKELLRLCLNGTLQKISVKSSEKIVTLTFVPVLQPSEVIDSITVIAAEESVKNQVILETDSQIADKLEYNKQIYENLFHNNPYAAFSFDMDGNFVDANISASKLAETSKELLLNMHFMPFVIPEDQERAGDHFMKAKKGLTQHYEIEFISTKNTKKKLSISNFPVYYKNEIVGVYGIAKDVTVQKNIEEKINNERKMLRAIIDNIPDYIFVKNKDHKSILSNRKFQENILGRQDESGAGFGPLDYFEKDKGESVIEDNEMVMKTGNPVINRPDLVKTKTGKEEMVLLTKVPLRNENEEIIGLVGIARDITETYLHNKKQELIFKLIKSFGDQPSFYEANVQTLKILCQELGYDYGETYKISTNQNHLIRNAFWPPKRDLTQKDNTYDIGDGLPGKIWEIGKVEIVRYKDFPHFFEDMTLNKNDTLRSAVGIPVYFQQKLISIICLGSLNENKEVDRQFLEDVALQIAPSIEQKHSQNQLNDFFRFSPNLIAVIGLDGFIKMVNPSFENKFGFSDKEILSHPFTEFIHPDDLARTYNAIKEISIDGSEFEIRCLKKNGDYLWISWKFSEFFENENIVFIYGTDITPLKQAHEELSKYKNILENSKEAVGILNIADNSLYLNKIFGQITGFGPDHIEEMKSPFNLIENKELRKEIEKGLNAGKYWKGDIKLLHKTGNSIDVYLNAGPIKNDDGELIAIYGILKDISQRKEYERQIKKNAEELKASNEELEQFAYIASHDLQEPLRMVTSFLTQLQKKYENDLDERAQKYIYFAHDGATRMRRIILDLLEYSRVGRRQQQLEMIDLNELLSEIVNLMQETVREKNAKISYENLPAIKMARSPLQQVLTNLISNALKYQPENNPPVINIEVLDNEEFWEFRVQDNGIGINEQFQEKIFVIFQRLHNREDYSGTGIGLAICKKIVTNFGGTIQVESSENRGSIFSFSIKKQF